MCSYTLHEPANPLERQCCNVIPEHPIIKNRFPVDTFQFNQNLATQNNYGNIVVSSKTVTSMNISPEIIGK